MLASARTLSVPPALRGGSAPRFSTRTKARSIVPACNLAAASSSSRAVPPAKRKAAGFKSVRSMPAPSTSSTSSSSALAAMPPAGSPLDPSYSHIPRPPPSGRRAGIILHPTSLPGPHGVGDLGPQAFAFVDFLAAAGIGAWQVLPLVPPETAYWSPYVGRDALCGSTLLLSPDALVEDGLVSGEDAAEALRRLPRSAGRGVGGRRGTRSVDYPAASQAKAPLLSKAARELVKRARKNSGESGEEDALASEMGRWREQHSWVEDSALFDALSTLDPECSSVSEWWQWPEPLRYRHEGAVAEARARYADAVDEFVALQFLFDRQWQALKVRRVGWLVEGGGRREKRGVSAQTRVFDVEKTAEKRFSRKKTSKILEFKSIKQTYANSKEVILVGDMPIYVGGHSADVWAHRDLFALGDDGSPRAVSGVPPDAFSATGQLWGSPLYDWPAHQREGFAWWARRLERARELYDLTRVDHFRAFAGYWSIPGGAETAMDGSWVSGPGKELFDAVYGRIGEVAIIAEDLGVITPDVTEVRFFFFFFFFFLPRREREESLGRKKKKLTLSSTSSPRFLSLSHCRNSLLFSSLPIFKQLRLSLGAPGMAVLQFAWGEK